MLMFSEDIVDISVSARRLADSLALKLMLMSACLPTGHYSDINISISIRRTQGFDILMLMLTFMSWPSSLAHKLLLRLCLFLYLCLRR